MKHDQFSDTQIQQALAHLQQFEQAYLGNSVQGFNNPFRRPGVTALDLAFACGFVREGETKSGRVRVDSAAARRLVKRLIEQGLVESTGFHRTMSAGSQAVECFALAGFTERFEAARSDWFQKD